MMNSWKIIKGLLVTLVILIISLFFLISTAITYILKARIELNEKIDSSLGVKKDDLVR
ncbi:MULTISPECIES: hypothetical protein [Flavobacterium]|uniref:hypothetical protein n=1 Tax=Flavobacterium TaxID=237 RepID=UPI0013F4E861|nr:MULTISPECIES: hypothetical protein [Flavobacterium]UUF13001.1 hypothetical protein NLJ00_17215 [Flavobacterium panici]